ncbi:fe-S metabolism associated domain protein [Prevotella sp. CAG:617]|jgi:cysteine desulfuration protein SufE|nr:fe-S metabolism associated domain protein [Prevotella sp. CAG:617]
MNNRSINEIQDEIIEDFSQVEDWMDRYQMIIDLGEELEPIDESERTATNLIEGCQSSVWLVCEEHDGRLLFRGDSNALIVKGLVSLLLSVVSNHTPQEILDADLYFIQRIGLSEHLSPTRSNGLLAMVKQIRMYALAEKELLSHRQA